MTLPTEGEMGREARIGEHVESPYREFVGTIIETWGKLVRVEWDDGDVTWSRPELLHWKDVG